MDGDPAGRKKKRLKVTFFVAIDARSPCAQPESQLGTSLSNTSRNKHPLLEGPSQAYPHPGPSIMAHQDLSGPALDSLGPYFQCLLRHLSRKPCHGYRHPQVCQLLSQMIARASAESHHEHLRKSCLCFCLSGLRCSASVSEVLRLIP